MYSANTLTTHVASRRIESNVCKRREKWPSKTNGQCENIVVFLFLCMWWYKLNCSIAFLCQNSSSCTDVRHTHSSLVDLNRATRRCRRTPPSPSLSPPIRESHGEAIRRYASSVGNSTKGLYKHGTIIHALFHLSFRRTSAISDYTRDVFLLKMVAFG